MLEFKKAFSVEKDIIPYIASQRIELGLEDEVELSARIVGQEQDGTLIYVWTDHPPVQAEPPEEAEGSEKTGDVTYVGICDPATKANQRIFIHDRNVRIVNATINQDHTFLGYVNVEDELIVNAYGDRQTQEIYRAFLAEIQPQSRVFYLNLERPYYLGLQFLYGQYKRNVPHRESHLIVFLHRNSIGLYNVPVARMGSEGVIMSEEPHKTQIFHKPYVWSQWDAASQRLHVVHFRKVGKDSYDRKIHKLFLTSYQFNVSCVNEFVLEVTLDLPIQKSSALPSYLHLGPCHHLPDAYINMEILTLPNGTVCICCQHPPYTNPNKQRVLSSPSSPDDLVNLQYSVIMVHHNKVLQRTGPKLPRHIADSTRIYFAWMGDYLLAYLPGVFTHLLNLGVEFDPCNHILWDDPSYQSSTSYIPREEVNHHNVSFICDSRTPPSGSGLGMYNIQQQTGYKVCVSMTMLCDIFTKTSNLALRLAILHYSVAHVRDLAVTKALIKIIVEDPLHPDVSTLLDEVLVGSTYTSLKRKIDRGYLKYFSSTTSEIMRGMLEKSPEGQTIGSLAYRSLGRVTLGERQAKWKWPDDTYGNLGSHRQNCRGIKQFSNKDVRKELNNSLPVEEGVAAADTSGKSPPSQGFLKKLGAKARSAFGSTKRPSPEVRETPLMRPPSRSEQLLGTLPPFFQTESHTVLHDQECIIAKTQQLLCAHLRSQMSREPSSKLEAIAKEYTSCQLEQARHLCHLIWSVMVPEDRNIHASLSEAGSPEEYELFLMLERYTLTLVDTAFPMTAGFQGFFTQLAFRCLEFRMFLQYLDQGVIVIDKDFALQLLADLDDDNENVEVKFQLLSRLPRLTAIECLRMWDHPESKRLLARDYTHACLNNELQKSWPVLTEDQKKDLSLGDMCSFGAQPDSPEEDFFPSLSTFIHLLEEKDPYLSCGDRGINPQFLEEAGLMHYHNDKS